MSAPGKHILLHDDPFGFERGKKFKFLLCQIKHNYANFDESNGKFIHNISKQYHDRLFDLIDLSNEIQSDVVIFPEYTLPFDYFSDINDLLSGFNNNTVYILPMEHLSYESTSSIIEFGTFKENKDEILKSLEAVPRPNRKHWISNLCLICRAKSNGLSIFFQPKLRAAEAEQGRQFFETNITYLYHTDDFRFITGVCFDLIQNERNISNNWRKTLLQNCEKYNVDLIFIPQCNPKTPLHHLFVEATSELYNANSIAMKNTGMISVNIADGTKFPVAFDNHFGYSQVIWDKRLNRENKQLYRSGSYLYKFISDYSNVSQQFLSASYFRSLTITDPKEQIVQFEIELPRESFDESKAAGAKRYNLFFYNKDSENNWICREPNSIPDAEYWQFGDHLSIIEAGIGLSSLPPYSKYIHIHSEEAESILEKIQFSNDNIISIYGEAGIGKSYLANYLAISLMSKKIIREICWVDARKKRYDIYEFSKYVANILGMKDVLEQETNRIPALLRDRIYQKGKTILLIIDSYENIDDLEFNSYIEGLPWNVRILTTSREKTSFIKQITISLNKITLSETKQLLTNINKINTKLINDNYVHKIHNISQGIPLVVSLLGSIDLSSIEINDFQNIDKILNFKIAKLAHEDLDILKQLSYLPFKIHEKNMIFFTPQKTQQQLDHSISKLLNESLIDIQFDKRDKYISLHPKIKYLLNEKYTDNINNVYEWIINICKAYGGHRNWKGYFGLDREINNILYFVDKLIDLKHWKIVIKIQYYLDYYLFARGRYSDRIELAKKAVKACKEIGDSRYEAVCYCDSIAPSLYYTGSSYSSVNRYYIKSLNIFQNISDNAGISMTYYYIGRLHRHIKNYEKAKKYLELALHVASSCFDMESCARIYGLSLNNMGKLLYDEDKPYSESSKIFKESLLIWDKLNDMEMKAAVERNLSLAMIKNNELEKANQLIDESLEKYINISLLPETIQAQVVKAKIKALLGEDIIASEMLCDAAKEYRRMGLTRRFDEVITTWKELFGSDSEPPLKMLQ